MQKSLANSARIALGIALLWGIGCGGSTSHPKDSGADATDAETGSAGTDGAAGGTAGVTGTAGTGGTAGTTDGGAGTGGKAGTDGGAGATAGTGGATAGTDGGGAGATAGTGGATAGTDGGAAGATAGTDGGAAGTDGGAAGTDGGAAGADAGADATDASDAGDATDAACTNACTLGAMRCGPGGGVQSCVTGQSTCTVWGTETACGTHQQCAANGATAACACIVDPNCGTATDTYCTGASLGTCAVDATTQCVFAVAPAACPAHQTCTGTKPSAACTCVPTPAECSGVAGTTCNGTGSAFTTCADDGSSQHCIFSNGSTNCGVSQTCSGAAGSGACSCNAPPAGCTSVANLGDFCGSAGESDHCAQDPTDHCFIVTVNRTCGTRQTCNGATGLCSCNAGGCSVAGQFCDGGGQLATCSQDGDQCFFVNGASTACGPNQACTGAAGAASCQCNPSPAICAGGKAGTYCSAGNTVTTCGPGTDACIIVTAGPTACGARQTCGGTAGAQSCTCNPPSEPGCTANGSFCPDPNHQSVCSTDGDNCLFVQAGSPSACPANQTCKGAGVGAGSVCTCDNTCTAAQAGGGTGTYCLNALQQATCTNDANSCHVSSNTIACVGTQTCQGADGVGACTCQPVVPAAVAVAGNGCMTLGATTCQGTTNIVLTCTRDTMGGCNVWTQTSVCTGGLVCGTKTGGGTVAACQCAEHTGNDYIVDPTNGSDAQVGVFPTGNDSPEECRYGTLGKGLSFATAGNRVVAKTDAGHAAFSAETFPLDVPSGVTLTTADAMLTPTDYTIDFTNVGGSTAGVVLANGSTVEGFTIQDSGAAGAASAILITGAGATVDTVVLEGSNALADGISVTGGGAGVVNAATIAGFTTGMTMSTTGSVALQSSSIAANVGGVALSNGTLTTGGTSGVTISGGSGVGVAISAVTGTSSTLNGTALTIASMAGGGISQSATGTGTVALSYASGDLGHCGATGAKGGINIAAGGATIGAVTIHDNTGVGLTQSTTGTVTLGQGGTTTVTTSSKQGVSITAGTLNVDTATITGNTLDGVKATTSSIVNFNTGAVLSSNGGDGVIANTATLNFITTAAAPIAVTGNTGDGIGLTAGGLTAKFLTVSSNANGISVANAAAVSLLGVNANDGDITIQNNTQNGVLLNGTPAGAIDMEKATVKGNGADGLSIDLGAGGVATGKFINVAVTGNTKNGIEVLRAPLGSGVFNLTFDTMTISGNGAAGVTLTGASGAVGASLTNSTVTGNTGVGVNLAEVGGTTTETLQNDTITDNKAGGITFSTASTLNSFTGNTVAGNTGDQITVSARQTGNATWDFQPPSLSCTQGVGGPPDPNRNQVYCYGQSGNPGVGIRVNAAPLATTVNAQNMNWKSSAPSAGTDFVATGTNAVTITTPCLPAVTTCPP